MDAIIEKYQKNPQFLMDILIEIQDEYRCISDQTVAKLAKALNISQVDIEQTRSFYHFFTSEPTGKYCIYINNSAVAMMQGAANIAKTFEKETGCLMGKTSKDGLFSLAYTADIGMNDQEPAVIINGKIFTKLNPSKVTELVNMMKAGKKVDELITNFGDGANAHPLVKSMVQNNIMRKGEVIFAPYTVGTALKKAISINPQDLIEEVKKSNLRGRGGAGFSTGMKWDFCRKSQGNPKYVLCNADEGEPGTFKDRVLLTELPKMIFEGMVVAAYAIGAQFGILYLRAEYRYLKAYLENCLNEIRSQNLLGQNIAGKNGFNFDIRIQLGAGAYVCGEESALIESAEGKRGEPRNRPPFPVQRGFLGNPTIINNVETFCSVNQIIVKGADWYKSIGTKDSAGTKVLSISGDCKKPGIYEIDWGMTISDMLNMVEATNVQAVQVAGPSGVCINPSQFNRKIAFEDLPTGGSMIIIGKNRNLLKEVVHNFMEFFVDESCGSCVPCRAMNHVLTNKLTKVLNGKGTTKDIEDMEKWSAILSKATRCGLGQTSSNPISTTIKNFRPLYEALVNKTDYLSTFNLEEAVKDSCAYVNRKANIH